MYSATWFCEFTIKLMCTSQRLRQEILIVSSFYSQSGLTRACMESSLTLPYVEGAVLDYIQKYIPEKRVGVLAGNSVHVDRMFLAERMPRLLDHLHYRCVLNIRYIVESP